MAVRGSLPLLTRSERWYIESMKRSVTGFTIVELLIVIVVIAILATISVVAYTGIQNRANDTAIQSDLKNIGQKVMAFQITEGKLPVLASEFASMELKASKNAYGHHYIPVSTPTLAHNMAWCPNASAKSFAIVAASRSGNVYVFTNGSVHQGVGPLTTVLATCSNNGHPSPGDSTWFYNNSNWVSYIGG